MNSTRLARSQNREASGAAPTGTPHRRSLRGRDRLPKAHIPGFRRSKEPPQHTVTALSPVIHQVVEGFMDSLQSTGEGVLPIVLVLHPELSTSGVAESDAEFARRGHRQSAVERRFFKSIQAALRDAMETVLRHGAHAAINRGDVKPRRRE